MTSSSTTPPAHTPPPWTVEHWLDSNGWPIYQLAEVHETPAQAEANAHLITAAPKMLVRLESLLEDLEGAKELMLSHMESDSWMVTEDGWDALIKPTRALITEAKGR
jgi:hypothetical protein